MTTLELTAIIAGYALAIARLLNAGKLLWGWLPTKAQPLLPALVTVLPLLAAQVGAVETKLALTEAIIVALGALTTSIRGAAGPLLKGPKGLLILLVAALSAQVGVACAPAVQPPSSAAVVEKATALAFNGASFALLWLDEQEAKYLDSLPHPTHLQLAEAELRVKSLVRARDALAIVRKALSGELGDLDERGKLREAVKALDLVAAELEARGVAFPSDLQQALAFARVVL